MPRYDVKIPDHAPSTQKTLAILEKAMIGASSPHWKRPEASAHIHCPAEGLALLNAYISIPDVKIRQAILDTLFAISSRYKET